VHKLKLHDRCQIQKIYTILNKTVSFQIILKRPERRGVSCLAGLLPLLLQQLPVIAMKSLSQFLGPFFADAPFTIFHLAYVVLRNTG
jgi:hypothetical protein